MPFVAALLPFLLTVLGTAVPIPTVFAGANPAQAGTEKPLPDIASLMHAVEAHQRQDELLQKDYIYQQLETVDEVDGQGRSKKHETRTYNVFWLEGVPVRKLIRRDGQPISADELRKEDARIDKEVAKVRSRREHRDDQGKQTDPRGNEEVSVARLLELGRFTNARRVQMNGRDTIAADYLGDPNAKTHNRAEEVIRDLAGTVWIDEQDQEIARTEGHFFRAFKMAGGLVGNIREGTTFSMQQQKINDTVWLPTHIEGHGAARFLLLFSFNGSLRIDDSDFRRFKTSSTLLPGVGKADEQP